MGIAHQGHRALGAQGDSPDIEFDKCIRRAAGPFCLHASGQGSLFD